MLPSLVEAPVTRSCKSKRIRNLLCLAGLACVLAPACRTPPAAPRTPPARTRNALAAPGHQAELPVANTETTKQLLSLPATATLESSVDPSDMITATDGIPFGFADVPWLLDRAGAWLRAHHGGANAQPTLWQRRDVHGWQTDVLEWRPEGFVLRTQGDDTTVLLSEAGCTVRVSSGSAKCEPDLRAQATMAAILTGLAWPEGPGRAAWSVEALHTYRSGRVYLRIALAKLHLRADMDLTADGTVTSFRTLSTTLQPDPDGMAFTRRDGSGWHWTMQPPGGREATARSVLRLDNAAGVEVTIDAWMAAAKPRGLVAIGPFAAEIDVREDGERVRALQAPVLAATDDAPWKGVQVVAVSATPVEAVYRCKRGDLVKELAKHVKPGCHVVQVLGISPDEAEAPSGEVRRDSQIVVAVRACP